MEEGERKAWARALSIERAVGGPDERPIDSPSWRVATLARIFDEIAEWDENSRQVVATLIELLDREHAESQTEGWRRRMRRRIGWHLLK